MKISEGGHLVHLEEGHLVHFVQVVSEGGHLVGRVGHESAEREFTDF